MNGGQARHEAETTSPVAGAEKVATPTSDGKAAASESPSIFGQIRRFPHVIRDGDDAMIEATVLDLSRRRRYLAPLAFAASALVMLFEGVRLLILNWRLSLIQVLPAMWVWAAMLDLKVHLLHGKSLHVLRGPILIPLVIAVMLITIAGFFLNAVFAFAIVRPGPPQIRAAFAEAKSHLSVIFLSGGLVGLLLGFSTLVVTRWGLWWFVLSLSIVVGLMMVAYVTVPSRLTGIKATSSKSDALKAAAVGGALGAVVCSPPYALGRVGILMLGSHLLFIPGIFVLVVGVTLQAGATGAVKAIKVSAKLLAGSRPEAAVEAAAGGPLPSDS